MSFVLKIVNERTGQRDVHTLSDRNTFSSMGMTN